MVYLDSNVFLYAILYDVPRVGASMLRIPNMVFVGVDGRVVFVFAGFPVMECRGRVHGDNF